MVETQISEIIFFSVFAIAIAIAIAVVVWGISLRMAAQIGKQASNDLPISAAEWQQPNHDACEDDPTVWEVEGAETTECDSPADAIRNAKISVPNMLRSLSFQ